MRLSSLPGAPQLTYCTNIHAGESWDAIRESLDAHVPRIKARVSPEAPFGLGLRLSGIAATELREPARLDAFKEQLSRLGAYVFTLNAFPFGPFHGTRVKEQVYRPDWTTPKRLAYTNLLFDLLAQLVPAGVEGSVSTLPGSFKGFISDEELMQDNIWSCVEHIAEVSARTGRKLHLGLEPEPFGWFETSEETIGFIKRLRAEHPNDQRLIEHLGVNYDNPEHKIRGSQI